MQYITGADRLQTTFSCPDDLIVPDDKVRVIAPFVNKLNMEKLGSTSSTIVWCRTY